MVEEGGRVFFSLSCFNLAVFAWKNKPCMRDYMFLLFSIVQRAVIRGLCTTCDTWIDELFLADDHRFA